MPRRLEIGDQVGGQQFDGGKRWILERHFDPACAPDICHGIDLQAGQVGQGKASAEQVKPGVLASWFFPRSPRRHDCAAYSGTGPRRRPARALSLARGT